MSDLFTEKTVRLICNLYDKGLDAADILERFDLEEEPFLEEIQNVICRHIQACDDTENPSEPGDLDYYPA